MEATGNAWHTGSDEKQGLRDPVTTGLSVARELRVTVLLLVFSLPLLQD